MKWLSMLKNKAGKLVLNGPGALVASAAVAVGVSTLAYNVGTSSAQKELQVRSFTSIEDTHNYEGMNRTADGQLTSMQMKDSLNQIATRAERERMEGGRSNDDFGLSAADGLSDKLRGFGSAAQTGETEGLGMGANVSVETLGGVTGPYSARSAQSANGGGRAVVVSSGEREGRTLSPASNNGGAQLQAAAVARASGNAFNAAAGVIASGNASGSKNAESNYQFSGAMPGSSSAVASLSDSARAHSTQPSGFLAGGRKSTVGKGSRTAKGGDDIKDIAKRSAAAAKNKNRSAVEASHAFLAHQRNSAGMNIDGTVETTETGSADFEKPAMDGLKKLKSWQDDQNQKEKEREKDRRRLLIMMLSFLAAAAGLLIAAQALLNSMSNIQKAFGYVLCGLTIALGGTLIGFAAHYSSKYHSMWMPLLGMLVGGGIIFGAAYTMSNPGGVHNWLVKQVKGAKGLLKKMAVFLGVSAAQKVVSQGMNDK